MHALFAHCFTCTKDIAAARHIAAKLAALGIAVLRFDFTGLGSSEGEFQNTNFSSNVDDLVAAANHLRMHHQAPRFSSVTRWEVQPFSPRRTAFPRQRRSSPSARLPMCPMCSTTFRRSLVISNVTASPT